MTQWDKLISRIKSLDKSIRFAELQKVLENYGYEMTAPKGGSSHFTFRKPGCCPITIPKHEPIKVVYVKMVKAVVECDNNSKNLN
ncbi:MAG: type II toxin-antitoxin system HicA family toxin [Bacteroidales bacterium]|nr:type II toxin-antitoxin system HicA family toxin [Bacteroidales bacterium]